MSAHRPRLAVVLAALCALALVAGLGVTFYLRGQEQDQQREAQDRAAVVSAAQVFTETWNTFTPDAAQEYVDTVSPLLTTRFRTEFTDAAEDVVTGITQQQLSSTGSVLSDEAGIPLVAIASMDGDSAEVLVVSDAERVSAQQEVLRHWRWQVSLVKVDGRWLVDDFVEV